MLLSGLNQNSQFRFVKNEKFDKSKLLNMTSRLGFEANKPADKLYSKFKFEYVEPEACGMKRK